MVSACEWCTRDSRGRWLHLRDAPARDLILVHVDAKGELDQDLELGARVEATDVKGRVGLGISGARACGWG